MHVAEAGSWGFVVVAGRATANKVYVPEVLAMLPLALLDPEPVVDMFDSESEFDEDLGSELLEAF